MEKYFSILTRLLLIVFGAGVAIFCSLENSCLFVQNFVASVFCGAVAFFSLVKGI